MSDKKEWVQHPGTKAFVKKLELDRQEIYETWASRSYTAEHADATAQLNAQALGNIEAINMIVDWIIEEDEDEDMQL